jgi:hypothetical protein
MSKDCEYTSLLVYRFRSTSQGNWATLSLRCGVYVSATWVGPAHFQPACHHAWTPAFAMVTTKTPAPVCHSLERGNPFLPQRVDPRFREGDDKDTHPQSVIPSKEGIHSCHNVWTPVPAMMTTKTPAPVCHSLERETLVLPRSMDPRFRGGDKQSAGLV